MNQYKPDNEDDSINDHLKRIKHIQKQLLKDHIVTTASRMVKDHDSDVVRGMTEIPARWIDKLNEMFIQLDKMDEDLQQINIDNS